MSEAIKENAAANEVGSASSVARSTALMSIATLGSRATGLIRTAVMAFALGNTFISSAYGIANNMPNVVYEFVAGGLISAAFIPVYLLQKERQGERGGFAFSNNILNILIIVLGVLSLLATVFAPQVIATQTFTRNSSPEVIEYAILFFRIFAIQILFYGIGGIISGILNGNRVYFLPSLAPALNNVIVIISFLIYIPLSAAEPFTALIVLAGGTTLGVVAQFAIQIPALLKSGYRYSPRIDLKDPALIEALKIAAPTFVYIIGTLISFSCRNAFSLESGANGPSTLNYAWMWYQLPHGVVAVSLSRALFTEMSAAVAREDWNGLRGYVKSGLSGTLFLIIPLAGVMFVMAGSFMQLFRAGAFSAEDVAYVATILSLWVVSLPFYSLLMYLYNIFASMRKFMVFALVSCGFVAIQCGLYAVLCNPGILGLAGVPVADFVYYGGCTITMLVILRHRIGSYGMGAVLWTAARVLAATLIGMGLIGLGLHFLPFGSGILAAVGEIALYGGIGIIVIFALCKLFHVSEMDLITRMVGKIGKVGGRFSRKGPLAASSQRSQITEPIPVTPIAPERESAIARNAAGAEDEPSTRRASTSVKQHGGPSDAHRHKPVPDSGRHGRSAGSYAPAARGNTYAPAPRETKQLPRGRHARVGDSPEQGDGRSMHVDGRSMHVDDRSYSDGLNEYAERDFNGLNEAAARAKHGKHAAGSKAASPSSSGRHTGNPERDDETPVERLETDSRQKQPRPDSSMDRLDPGMTGAIMARAKHGRPKP